MIMNFRRKEPVKVIQYTMETEEKILELLNDGEWASGGEVMENGDGRYIRYYDCSWNDNDLDLGEYLIYDADIDEAYHYSEEDLLRNYVKIEEER